MKHSFYSNLISLNDANTNIAIETNDTKITYNHLLELINQAEKILPNEGKVALLMPKSPVYIVLLLACLKKKLCFIPIPKDSPRERIASILADARPDLIIMSTPINISEIDLVVTNPIKHKLSNDTLLFYPTNHKPITNSLAFTIYTSGSTGKPKGVEVTEKGLFNIIKQQVTLFNIQKNSRFFWFLSHGFDASLSDILATFYSGATLFIPKEMPCHIIKNYTINKLFNDLSITHSDLPPSLIKTVNPKKFLTLKHIVVGGEVADKNTLHSYFEQGINIYNVYGPTEATICTSMVKYSPSFKESSIGFPIKNIEYFLMDSNNHFISSTETPGELLISGVGIAKGYTDSNLTKERFIKIGKKVFYKTGDICFFNHQGEWFFNGRKDRQFKHNGQLICPEEIENALLAHPNIQGASVHYNNHLIKATIELKNSMSEKEIINFIENKIPPYMLPKKILSTTKSLIKNINGKVDHKEINNSLLSNPYFKKVEDIFKQLLKIEHVDPFLSFEEQGGDSLSFLSLILELENIGIERTPSDIVESNSVYDIIQENLIKKENFLSTSFIAQKMPETIQSYPIESFSFKQNANNIFITGANGFLGIHLIEKIQKLFPQKNIYCAVRANSIAEGLEKIKKSCTYHNLNIDLHNLKIVLVTLEDSNLGLDDDFYNTLSLTIDCIFHCAANVNNILTFNALFEDNVISTKNLLEFSYKGISKAFHNMSTLSVLISGEHNSTLFEQEETLKPTEQQLYTGYAQTKWLSEYFIQQHYINNNIKNYRLGLLTPRQSFPIFKNNQFMKLAILEILKAEHLPIECQQFSLDITPIDCAVTEILSIAFSDRCNLYNYHITFDVKMSIMDIINIQQHPIKWITKEEWLTIYKETPLYLYFFELHNKWPQFSIFETTRVSSFDTQLLSSFNKQNIFKIYIQSIVK